MASAGNITETLERSPCGMSFRKVAQIVNASDFTDNADTTGSLTMNAQIPVGAFVLGTKVEIKNAFDDDTTAVMTVGKSDGEDEFSDGTTLNLASAGTVGDSAEDPLEFIATAQSVYLKITSATDFSLVAAGDGKMLVEVFYLSTDLELTAGYPVRIQL